ncbi:hypothetical protein EV421DRAFT_1735847 [Armillaria borealis]|uniref:Uncharacterized protein n=1 Tax=Armillaria borealis TaxID=47425 RepID=A0AA39JI77_9AGAR|nr:hypothetical protein EV421DRAFT_1735847 [Armillaria borealis]
MAPLTQTTKEDTTSSVQALRHLRKEQAASVRRADILSGCPRRRQSVPSLDILSGSRSNEGNDDNDGWPSGLPDLDDDDNSLPFDTVWEMDSSSRTPNRRQHCKLDMCNAIAHRACGLCKSHCLQDLSFVCAAHGVPARCTPPFEPAILLHTAKFATRTEAGVVERSKRRDQVLSEKERAIQVTLFYKDGAEAEVFQLFVELKDWPFCFPLRFSIINRVCNISEKELTAFQRYEDGTWVNHEQKVTIQRGDHLILRLLGVKDCPGLQGKKRSRTPSVSATSATTDQPSPTKTMRSSKGVAIPSSSLPASPVKALTAGVQAIDINSDGEEDDDDKVIFIPRPSGLADALSSLPVASDRSLEGAAPNRTGENGWPFMWAVDQHECFLQVDNLIATKEMKVREAFLQVVPQAKRWVDKTWNRHYGTWRRIQNSPEGCRRLLRAINAGRSEQGGGKWSQFILKEKRAE